jgi:hypothetical protein
LCGNHQSVSFFRNKINPVSAIKSNSNSLSNQLGIRLILQKQEKSLGRNDLSWHKQISVLTGVIGTRQHSGAQECRASNRQH